MFEAEQDDIHNVSEVTGFVGQTGLLNKWREHVWISQRVTSGNEMTLPIPPSESVSLLQYNIISLSRFSFLIRETEGAEFLSLAKSPSQPTDCQSCDKFTPEIGYA